MCLVEWFTRSYKHFTKKKTDFQFYSLIARYFLRKVNNIDVFHILQIRCGRLACVTSRQEDSCAIADLESTVIEP